jgi:hypothetical protein
MSKQSKQKRRIVRVDLSGCKNMKECTLVVDMISLGKIKITVDEHTR